MRRAYFYFVDLQGRLHLDGGAGPLSAEEAALVRSKRSIATALRDPKALSLIFRRVVPSTEMMGYPFVSPCQGELNFICPEDSRTPIVFTDLAPAVESPGDMELVMNFSLLRHPFDPNLLSFCPSTGRFFHSLTQNIPKKISTGLIRSQLAMELSSKIIPDPQSPSGFSYLMIPIKLLQ